MAMTLRVVVPPHPLIAHWLTMLRNASTPPPLYAKALEELGRWLTYEALRDWLPNRSEEVTTPSSVTKGFVIEHNIPLLAIPNLPGGLELWHGAREVLPNAQLCIGGIPIKIENNAGMIIYQDQICTGNELLKVLNALKNQEIESRRIRIITALASNPGLKNIGENYPDLNIFCACIDPELTNDGIINPGIGKPSLRLSTRITGLN